MDKKTEETVIIIDGNYSNLLGCDILRKIRLNWNELLKVNQVKEHFVDNVQLNDILIQYKNVFNSDLGTLKNVEIKLKTKPNSVPKFCKACPLPYALVDCVKRN